jgi:hypothetical protein
MTPSGQLPRRRKVTPIGDVVRFVDDEDGYVRWLREHPNGYVLNCDREPSDRYLVLHETDCRTISGEPSRGTTWTTAYAKVCASTQIDLVLWCQEITGSRPDRCGTCEP